MEGSRTECSSPDLRRAFEGPLDLAAAAPIIHQPVGAAACPGSVSGRHNAQPIHPSYQPTYRPGHSARPTSTPSPILRPSAFDL